jgi:hypothetical protein
MSNKEQEMSNVEVKPVPLAISRATRDNHCSGQSSHRESVRHEDPQDRRH